MKNCIQIVLIGILISGCEFVNDISETHEELTTFKLGTETMSPRNKYGKVYELDYGNKKPNRFDIIEFKYEDEYFDKNDFYSSNQHISRVIGMPDDTIEIRGGFVYINNTLLNEPFLIDSSRSNDDFPRKKIKENHYFVMVDNRKMIDSFNTKGVVYKPYDSRKIGNIHESKIIGITNLK